jgi:RHS repeat-associated protein
MLPIVKTDLFVVDVEKQIRWYLDETGLDEIFAAELAQNRLVQWFYYANGSQPVNGDLRTDFVYDGLSRLRSRSEYQYIGSWYPNGTTTYIYDGLRVIQERVGGTPNVAYTRGSDLSGTFEGAGGIGGLLARSSGYSSGNWSTHNRYFAHGNGNITYLVNSSQGLAASYRYDPFGKTVSSSGTLASANVYRFSSKEIHVNSGMYYYGYRFYDPNLQRWLNRDPLRERGGPNLFSFVLNDPVDRVDALGTSPGFCVCNAFEVGPTGCIIVCLCGTDPVVRAKLTNPFSCLFFRITGPIIFPTY